MLKDSSEHSPAASTIGEDLTITGNVSSKGAIHLEGRIVGDVDCVSLVLGENSQLEGNVVAESVLIRGRLVGSVRAPEVTLQATSHVEGDLLHQSLAIEQGAFFEGKSRRSEGPISRNKEGAAGDNVTKLKTPAEPADRDKSGPELRPKVPEKPNIQG
jgi:cytoskeletal protein CcmA (bactofilin family)